MMENVREKTLTDLVRFRVNPVELRAQLMQFPWDSDRELVTLKAQDIVNVLQHYLVQNIGSEAVENWANMIEGREDIAFENDLKDIIFQLANPELTKRLDPLEAKRICGLLGCKS